MTTNKTLIQNFIHGKQYEKNGSLTNKYNKLYSYNLLIADRDKREIYKTKYSHTTTCHINRLIELALSYEVISS